MEASGLVTTRAWFGPGLPLQPHEHATASVAVVLHGGWEGELGSLGETPAAFRRRFRHG